MLKTRKHDIFKLYYWHNAILVGKYRLQQLEATHAMKKRRDTDGKFSEEATAADCAALGDGRHNARDCGRVRRCDQG